MLTQVLIAIAGTVVLFSLLVAIHESGHFITARLFGVRAPEFMIGLPGPNIGFTRKGTKFGVTAIPLGGYVKIAGMEPGPEHPLLGDALAVLAEHPSCTAADLANALSISEEEAYEVAEILYGWDVVSRTDPKRGEEGEIIYTIHDQFRAAPSNKARLDEARTGTYRGLSFPKKLIVLSSGVVVNIVVAVLIIVGLFSLYGVDQSSTTSTICVSENAPAIAAGVKSGDTITAVNGHSVSTWEGLVSQIQKIPVGETVAITVDRDGTSATYDIVTKPHPSDSSLPYIGIEPSIEHVRLSVGDSLKAGLTQLKMMAQAVAGLFQPAKFVETVNESSSIVGIAAMTGQVVQQGFIQFISLLAAISISLGLMNILPIPPLDGGKVVIEIGQKIARREFSTKVQTGLSVAGIALILMLFVYATGHDILRLATGAFPWQ